MEKYLNIKINAELKKQVQELKSEELGTSLSAVNAVELVLTAYIRKREKNA